MLGITAGAFFVLLFLGFPISMAMGCAGFIGLNLLPGASARALAQKIFTAGDSFALMAMPFFMLGGQVMETTGITQELVNFSKKLVGWLRGGLAYTTTVAGVLMAGISGSANADTAALGAITQKAMVLDGWDEGMSCAVVASAGGLGPIIPPSIACIVYASISNLSVGSLFMAGYIPGIALAITYMVIEGIYAKRHNMPRQKFGGFKDLGKSFLKAIWALLMPVIIIVGILTGITTATEAGVISAVYGICYGFITRRLTWKELKGCARRAVKAAAGPMSIILMCTIVGYIFTAGGLSRLMENWFMSVSHDPIVFSFLIIIICTIAGMFLDGAVTMLILVPILLPIARNLGMGLLHMSMIFLIGGCSGGITPPVGATLLITCSIGNVPIKRCFRAIIPFVVADLVVAILIVFFPWMVEWIPTLVGYTV